MKGLSSAAGGAIRTLTVGLWVFSLTMITIAILDMAT